VLVIGGVYTAEEVDTSYDFFFLRFGYKKKLF
jgi:hypothetical protein